jgi:cation diffusion facilitator CzcD-associated flavoprotein CzcO
MGVSESEKIGSVRPIGGKQPRIIVIGMGLSGIAMGIRLMEAGFTDFTAYEKAEDLGGTWHYNHYPGLRCDVPSYYYQYSFSPSTNWSHRFCGGPEIKQYYIDTAKKYNVYERIKFNVEVKHAEYRDGQWHIEMANGETDSADFLIASCGILVRPKYPDIPGLDDFEGKVLHTARWEDDLDLKDLRVAVIGNGSTGIQMIKPLTDICKKVYSFQRTPQWIVPVPNRKYTAIGKKIQQLFPPLSKFYYYALRFVMERVMGVGVIHDGWARRNIARVCQWNLNSVKDFALRKRLTPDYTPMCKRLVMSSEFYPSIQKSNAELVTDHIDHVEAKGIVTKDGKLREMDVIALATGYHAAEHMLPMTMSVEDGPTLADAWKGGPRAYRTVSMPGFPNFFMVMGPNSPVGNISLASVAETQSKHITRFIKMWADGKFQTLAPKEDATERFNTDMIENMKDTVWLTGCASWYLDESGVPVSWPWTAHKFRDDLNNPKLYEYELN